MIGDNPHRLLRFAAVVVSLPRNAFQIGNYAAEQICFIPVRQSVQKGQQPIQTEPRIHVFIFERRILAPFQLFVLHIHIVTDFDIIVAERIEPFVIRSAGGADGAFKLPPIILFGKIADMFRRNAEVF